ncbi:hypothetical protein OF83DRAFT_779596 [Amylostereum chailletii]|nr:hypothetical protein OF83DRAFT_779596 [Amylostereum chailletii]
MSLVIALDDRILDSILSRKCRAIFLVPFFSLTHPFGKSYLHNKPFAIPSSWRQHAITRRTMYCSAQYCSLRPQGLEASTFDVQLMDHRQVDGHIRLQVVRTRRRLSRTFQNRGRPRSRSAPISPSFHRMATLGPLSITLLKALALSSCLSSTTTHTPHNAAIVSAMFSVPFCSWSMLLYKRSHHPLAIICLPTRLLIYERISPHYSLEVPHAGKYPVVRSFTYAPGRLWTSTTDT